MFMCFDTRCMNEKILWFELRWAVSDDGPVVAVWLAVGNISVYGIWLRWSKIRQNIWGLVFSILLQHHHHHFRTYVSIFLFDYFYFILNIWWVGVWISHRIKLTEWIRWTNGNMFYGFDSFLILVFNGIFMIT